MKLKIQRQVVSDKAKANGYYIFKGKLVDINIPIDCGSIECEGDVEECLRKHFKDIYSYKGQEEFKDGIFPERFEMESFKISKVDCYYEIYIEVCYRSIIKNDNYLKPHIYEYKYIVTVE